MTKISSQDYGKSKKKGFNDKNKKPRLQISKEKSSVITKIVRETRVPWQKTRPQKIRIRK